MRKLCFWCGNPAFTYLGEGCWIHLKKVTCQTCLEWDRDRVFAGLPGLQATGQMVLDLPIPPTKEAIVLTGEEFLEHVKKLL